VTEEDLNLHQLPRGWIWTRLEELADVVDVNHKMPKSVEDGVHFISPKDFVEPEGIDFENAKRISKEDFQRLCRKCKPESGDLIYSRIGTIGKVRKVPHDTLFQVSYSLCLIKPVATLKESDILYIFLKSPSVLKQALAKRRSIGVPDLGLGDIKKFMIPLAPLNEQRRIVTRVEELFTRLDAGVESLKKVKAQLKRYRQAVLKYAFEGKLTKEWRKTHTELRPVFAESPVAPKGSSSSSNLPKDWLLLTIPNIVTKEKNSIKRGPFGSSIRKEFFMPSGYKVYEQKNVIYNNFNLGNYYIDEDKLLQLKDFELKSGDVVITCSGTIGKIAIAPTDLKKGIINQALLKLTLDEAKVSAKYFLHLFTSKMHDIILDATRGSAMKNISSVKDLKRMLFPIPPLIEQQKIVEEIEQRLSVADEIEKTASQTVNQAERLRQSILKQAFAGKLVHQDPSDEPAERLLERIREERAKSKDEKNINKKKTKPKQLELSSYVK